MYCMRKPFNGILKTKHLSIVLTVVCVDTSSSDFIKDHVLGTTWEAALHTATYIETISAPELSIDYVVYI